MVTIQDVARHANVSVSAVSRVLSEDPSFSTTEDTRRRIMESVEALHYTPLRRRRAKSAPSQTEEVSPSKRPGSGSIHSHTKGATDPNPAEAPHDTPASSATMGFVIATTTEEERSDPYYASIRYGVEKKCAEAGVLMKRIIRLHEAFDPSDLDGLDGLVVVGATDIEDISRLFRYGQHIVLVNNLIENDPRYDVVRADFVHATNHVIDTLVGLGHQRIGFIGGMEEIRNLTSRERICLSDVRSVTYEGKMRALGLYDPALVKIGDWSAADAERMTRQLLQLPTPPTALIVASDPMSIGVIRVLRDAGLHIPDDISLISYDDIEAAAFTNPPLSTVRVHPEEIGKQAGNLLVERLRGRLVPIHVTVLSQLVVRSSFSTVRNPGNPHKP